MDLQFFLLLLKRMEGDLAWHMGMRPHVGNGRGETDRSLVPSCCVEWGQHIIRAPDGRKVHDSRLSRWLVLCVGSVSC